MNVNAKYLKDEDNNIISPVTSANTVYDKSDIPLSTESYTRCLLYYANTTQENTRTKLNFAGPVYSNQTISSSQGIFTITVSGTYIVNLMVHCTAPAGSVVRVFTECETNIKQSTYTHFDKYRSNDNEAKIIQGDCCINSTWLINLESGNTLTFYVYPVGGYVTIKGQQDTDSTDGVYTQVYIKRLSSLY